jgi:hypothetical protein
MSAAWVAALTALIVAICGLMSWGLRHLWRITRRTSHFLDDYFGEPARDGLPARPGVMARLAQHESILEKLFAETQPNGGSSLHDVLSRTERAVDEIRSEQVKMRARMEQLETQRIVRDYPEVDNP